MGCAVSRKKCCHQPDQRHRGARDSQYQRIEWRDFEQQACHHSCQRESSQQSEYNAHGDHRQSSAQYMREHFTGLRAQGHANTDFLALLRYGMRDEPVKANCGENDRYEREGADKPGRAADG